MTVLFWPRHDADESLPNTAGVVVGWFHDDDTVICARILYHTDNELMKSILKRKRSRDGLQMIGKWDPRTRHVSSPSMHDLQTFAPTPVGPWWSDRNKEDEDLLVYYKPGQLYTVTSDQLGFASILVRLNQVETIVERLKQPVSDKESNVSAQSSVPEEKPPEKHATAGATSSFLGKNSLLMHHLSQGSLLHRAPLWRMILTDKNGSAPPERVNDMLDLLLGIFWGAFLFCYSERICQTLECILSYNDHLRAAIVWLESFPAGFKLNVPFTRTMGHQLLLLLDHWQSHVLQPVLGSIDRRSLIVKCLAMTSFVFGFTTLLALLVDAVQVFTVHLTLIHLFYARVHKFQLYMLSSLWKLFRGKKRNPLRQRTDTMEYDSMQLLVGMLAFTFVLFLFTTILVYHVFFGTITFLIQPVGLWLVFGLVNDFPFFRLWERFLHPTKVGVGIFLKEQSPTTAWLCVIPRTYISVMTVFSKRYLGRILRLSLAAAASMATGERLEMLRRCISDDEYYSRQ